MADNDDKPTADEVDEVEMEAARGGTAAVRHSIEEDSVEARLRAGDEFLDPAERRPPSHGPQGGSVLSGNIPGS